MARFSDGSVAEAVTDASPSDVLRMLFWPTVLIGRHVDAHYATSLTAEHLDGFDGRSSDGVEVEPR
jgi:hypothetical protein